MQAHKMPILTNLDLQKSLSNKPAYVLNSETQDEIQSVLFSPYDLSQDLIILAFTKKIIVAQLNFHDALEKNDLVEFSQDVACTSLAMSPETFVNILPALVVFAGACSDFSIRIFCSDLQGSDTCKVYKGHTDYINDISYDPENNYIASCSDDCTAILWSTLDYSKSATFKLSSPGRTVCWHKEDSLKLLVAEKMGIIRLYIVNTQRPFLSLDFGKPLSAAHWAPSDSQLVGSLQNGELVLWNLTRPSRPLQVKLLNGEQGGAIKFSPLGELVASTNELERSLTITHVSSQQLRLLAQLHSSPVSLTWHYRLPIIAVGDDTRVCFWKVT